MRYIGRENIYKARVSSEKKIIKLFQYFVENWTYTSIYARSVNMQRNEYDGKMNIEKKSVLLQKARYTNK